MEWSRKRSFILFVILILVSCAFILLVYDIPKNFKLLIASNGPKVPYKHREQKENDVGVPDDKSNYEVIGNEIKEPDYNNNNVHHHFDWQNVNVKKTKIKAGDKIAKEEERTHTETFPTTLHQLISMELKKFKMKNQGVLGMKVMKHININMGGTFLPDKQKGLENDSKEHVTGSSKVTNVSTEMKLTSISDNVKISNKKENTFVNKVDKNNDYKRRLPNAIIIGSKKGGTRALLQQLSVHPKIVISGKEVHFFDRHYEEGLEWYRQQMPKSHPGEITMEKTPAYFVVDGVPEKIFDMSKNYSIDIKLLVILRDPVQRAISDYAQGYQRFLEKRRQRRKKKKMSSFESKVFYDLEEKTVDPDATFIKTGLYSEHLKRWLKFFDRSKLHFVSGEKLISAPWEELFAVQKFLNISVSITKDNFWYNETKKFYCMSNTKKHGKIRFNPKCLGKTKGRKHPDINQQTIKILRDFYKPYNKEFYKMVGRNFEWPE